MTEMARRPVDDLIDAAQQALEELRVAVHASIDASSQHQAASEALSHEAQSINPEGP